MGPMMRLAAAYALSFAGLFLLAPTAIADSNCSDYSSQQAAQDFFDSHPGDPDHLDGDGDGVACEALSRGGSGSGSGPPLILSLLIVGVVGVVIYKVIDAHG